MQNSVRTLKSGETLSATFLKKNDLGIFEEQREGYLA